MKVVVVQNKKEWLKSQWKPDNLKELPVIEDEGMPRQTYKITEVDDE
jgi:hypothetical protein